MSPFFKMINISPVITSGDSIFLKTLFCLHLQEQLPLAPLPPSSAPPLLFVSKKLSSAIRSPTVQTAATSPKFSARSECECVTEELTYKHNVHHSSVMFNLLTRNLSQKHYSIIIQSTNWVFLLRDD